jgi:hypothetical protein
MAIWTVRHPNMLIRWARRGFGAWSAWRLVKATIRQQQFSRRVAATPYPAYSLVGRVSAAPPAKPPPLLNIFEED